ncbi:hypothetical protein [Neptuniibacter sp.]|uniref:hypothetical protein n=1 Tax=Neptuniibacter sp. TaxID=1962643 RepID=UPI003B59E826
MKHIKQSTEIDAFISVNEDLYGQHHVGVEDFAYTRAVTNSDKRLLKRKYYLREASFNTVSELVDNMRDEERNVMIIEQDHDNAMQHFDKSFRDESIYNSLIDDNVYFIAFDDVWVGDEVQLTMFKVIDDEIKKLGDLLIIKDVFAMNFNYRLTEEINYCFLPCRINLKHSKHNEFTLQFEHLHARNSNIIYFSDDNTYMPAEYLLEAVIARRILLSSKKDKKKRGVDSL